MKKTIFYSITVLFLILVNFLIGEVFTRLFHKGNILFPENGQVIDPYGKNPYIVSFKPFILSHLPKAEYTQSRSGFSVSYKINSLGFREKEIEPKSNKKRIAVVGDSLVEGHGVEYHETFVYHLKNKFQEDDIEIYNLGIQGTSLLPFSANLKRYFQFQPDIILISIFENDWLDDRKYELSYFTLPYIENPSIYFVNKNIFLNNSKFVQFLNPTLHTYLYPYSDVEKIIKDNLKSHKHLNKFEVLLSIKKHETIPAELTALNFSLSSKYVDYIIDECSKRGIKVYFLNLTNNIYSPESSKEKLVSIEKSNELFEEYLLKKQIPYLSIKDIVLKYYEKETNKLLYIEGDGHPTREAHFMYFNHIYPWLKSLL